MTEPGTVAKTYLILTGAVVVWLFGKGIWADSGGDLKSAFAGGVSINNPILKTDFGQRTLDALNSLAIAGSKVPVLGENLFAPLSSVAYGTLVGWQY